MKIKDKIYTILAYGEANCPDNIKLKLFSENLVDNENLKKKKKKETRADLKRNKTQQYI